MNECGIRVSGFGTHLLKVVGLEYHRALDLGTLLSLLKSEK